MRTQNYLMENEDESKRLEMKTDYERLEHQALWAGLKEGMRVADVGCGPGITSSFLHKLVGKNGSITAFDIAPQRIEYAKEHYQADGIDFQCRDVNDPLDDLGTFDFIWVRFLLEYHRTRSFEIVKRITKLLKPRGILCLIDLDHNCLSHYGLSDRLEKSLTKVTKIIEKHGDFDPYVGRKLYSHMYDLGFKDLNVNMKAHHLIYGELSEVDEFNWIKKIEIAAKNSGYDFPEYTNGYEGFLNEARKFLSEPRRFTYTPIISCRGIKGA
ncbi:MAG: methyltransferase domain-containing protein [Spirochaetales bacterium]|nr:methyltransferase domain-containing protein [Spirochaetales bacterium]